MTNKWVFSISKTEDDHFLFFGKVPKGIMMVAVKAVAGVGAVMAIIKQYFFS